MADLEYTVSLLSYLSSKLRKFRTLLSTTFKQRDRLVISNPPESIDLITQLQKTIEHELTAPKIHPNLYRLLQQLNFRVKDIIEATKEGYKKCNMEHYLSFVNTIYNYEKYIGSATDEMIKITRNYLDPILDEMFTDAEKSGSLDPVIVKIFYYVPMNYSRLLDQGVF